MRSFTSGRLTLVTFFSVTLVAVCLVAQPAAAQMPQHTDGLAPVMALPSAPVAEVEAAPSLSPVLATEAAARSGIARAEVRTDARAAVAAQPSENTVRWAIIIGVAVLAALLIVALAD